MINVLYSVDWGSELEYNSNIIVLILNGILMFTLRLSSSSERKVLSSFKIVLSPCQMDRQVVAGGRKLNLRRDLCWVAKRTRKFPHKCTHVAKKNILRQTILCFIG